MSDRQKGLFLAVMCPCLWGIMGVFVRILNAAGIDAAGISFFRCAASAAILWVLLALRKPQALKTSGTMVLVSAVYGVVCYSASFTAYSVSVSRIPVAVAMILMFLCPVWVTLFSAVLFKEKPGKRTVLAIAVCLCGAALAADLMSVGGARLDGLGMLMGLFNGMGAALQIVVPRCFARWCGKDTMLVYGFTAAAVVLAFFTDFPAVGAAFRQGDPLRLGLAALAVSVLCTTLANVSYVHATDHIPATEVSILSALEVVVGSLAGFVIYHEHLSALQLLGMVLVIAGALSTQLTHRAHHEK